MKNYTRISDREKLYIHSKATDCECEYCDSKLLQIGEGIEEHGNIIPLFRCSDCKYFEIIVNDNNNAIIRKVTKMY